MPLIALLPGDGIGPEVIAEARRVLDALDLDLELRGGAGRRRGLQGGGPSAAARDARRSRRRADAILFGAVGDPRCDTLERALRPEQAILGLRKELGAVRQSAPGQAVPRAGGRLRAAARGRARDRPGHRPRAERRRLFRREGHAHHRRRACAKAMT